MMGYDPAPAVPPRAAATRPGPPDAGNFSRSNHGQTILSPVTDSGNRALTWEDWWAILGLNQ